MVASHKGLSRAGGYRLVGHCGAPVCRRRAPAANDLAIVGMAAINQFYEVHRRVAMQILRHNRIAVTIEIYTEIPSAATRQAL
jgi:hypothetical protein